ncbi:7330_t:CDS:2 [Gigaspora margarita]|uniref:Altered inheritance of mitochondria protein 24, mitochondrial n=1 Tax=Gigaspora margarita TaxID=4874 RepID=A0ABN7VI38_GIGMA|nr:7330_t:CDS:2 [Gigaspora margarita]
MSFQIALSRGSIVFFKRFARSYIDLAYNTNISSSNQKLNAKAFENSGEINRKVIGKKDVEKEEPTIGKEQKQFLNVNSPEHWTKQHPIPDPTFEVISPGTLGALLLVKVPPRSEIFAMPGSAIAVSSKVQVERITNGNIIIAVGRKLAGGSLIYHKFTTGSHPGDILLGPNNLSDIAVINMDGPRVSVHVSRVYGMGALNAFANCVTGRGILAISNYGAIHRLVLNPGDIYLVNAKNLIAWNSQTNPIVASSLISPSSIARNRLVKNMRERLSKISSSFLDTYRSSPSIKPTLDNIKRISVKTRKLVFGGPEFLQLSGPGDFYLSTRIEPVLGGLKLFTSPSIEEIVAANPEPWSPNNSSSQQYPPYIPTMSYAIVSDKGEVTLTKLAKGQTL